MFGVYDVSVCVWILLFICGRDGFYVKNGGFLLVCGVLMAVDWGKAGRFGCFFTVCCDFGLLWRLRLCDLAWFPGAFGALICRNFVCFCICACVNVFVCRKMYFYRCVLCDGVWCGELIVKKTKFLAAFVPSGDKTSQRRIMYIMYSFVC